MTAVIKVIFLIGLICCTVPALAQSNSLQDRQLLAAQIAAAATPRLAHHQIRNIPTAPIQIPESLLSKPRALKKLLNQHFPLTNASLGIHAGEQQNTSTCHDTSYRRLMGIYNSSLFIESVTQTSDGGMLVPTVLFDSTRRPNPWSRSSGLLLKLDGDGNVVWLKQFEDLTPGDQNFFLSDPCFRTGQW